jgi:hypothetical protein
MSDPHPLRRILNNDEEFVASLSDDQLHSFDDLCWIEENVIVGADRERYFTMPLAKRIDVLMAILDKRDDLILNGSAL